MNASMSRRRTALLLVSAVAVVVVIAGLWWTKTVAFSKSASVQVFPVDTTPSTGPAYQGNLMSVQSFGGAIDVKPIADRVASRRGIDAEALERDLSATVDGPQIVITARGRTPTAAVELANDAADVLANMFTDIPPSDDGITTTATVTRRAN